MQIIYIRYYICDHPYRVLIIGGSGLGKTHTLLNLIKHQHPDVDKIYLYVKDSFESKYQFLIKKGLNIKSTFHLFYITILFHSA